MAVVQRCYDLGINYFDNSHNYWEGRSDEVYGAVLPPFRRDVFITTKCDARDRKGAERALEALVAAKKAGKRRFIGFTVHGDPNVVVQMLKAYEDSDATLIPLNPADPHYMSFERIALPAVIERGLGLQVMKSLGNGKLLTSITARECINYALSLPTHCIALGMTSIGQVDDDVRSTISHRPLSDQQMDDL